MPFRWIGSHRRKGDPPPCAAFARRAWLFCSCATRVGRCAMRFHSFTHVTSGNVGALYEWEVAKLVRGTRLTPCHRSAHSSTHVMSKMTDKPMPNPANAVSAIVAGLTGA